MKIGYARVSTIEQNLAWHSRSAAQADVQQSEEINAKSPSATFVYAAAIGLPRPLCSAVFY
jgi:hypothetical protein